MVLLVYKGDGVNKEKLLLLTFRGIHVQPRRLAAAQRGVLAGQNRHGLRHVLLQVGLGRKQRLNLAFLLFIVLSRSPLTVPLLLAVGQDLTEGRQYVRRSVRFLFLAAYFVLQLAQTRFGFAGSGDVEHAGRHVVPRELDVHQNLSSVFICLASFVQQLEPSV